MLVIFGWSTDVGSAAHTSSIIERICASLPLLRDLPRSVVEMLDYGVRKAAHITEYAVLALLAYRAIRQDGTRFRDVFVWGPVLLCFLYASTDEYHQTFVASRWPSFGDVLYDTFGGMLGTVINLWRYCRNRE